VAVLVALVVIALIAMALVKAGRSRREAVAIEERRLQADSLASAGLDRALVRLSQAPGYRGETWEVAAAELGGSSAGRVTTRVEPVKEQPTDRRISIQADYPADSEFRARESRELIVYGLPALPVEERTP
jgi:hypothetical protein